MAKAIKGRMTQRAIRLAARLMDDAELEAQAVGQLALWTLKDGHSAYAWMIYNEEYLRRKKLNAI